MAWNGSEGKAHTLEAASSIKGKDPSLKVMPTVLGLLVALIGIAIWYYSSDTSVKTPPGKSDNVTIPNQRASVTNEIVKVSVDQNTLMRARIEKSISPKVKDFVTKPATNKIDWLSEPLADNDPDRGLLTHVSQELATLLASAPGDKPMPWPYSFMGEDSRRAAGAEVDADGGTSEFVESIKKYKISIKEGDDEHRVAFKQKMIDAQLELMSGIDQGMSVNDSIRAAYEFRVKAYELRSAAIKTMCEFLENGDSEANTIEVMNVMNEQLKSEGIKTISPEELGIETEDDEAN